MAARRAKCATCGTPFVPQRATARYCRPACREKARRDRAAAATKTPAKRPGRAAKKTTKPPAKRAAAKPKDQGEAPTPGLVESVRRDLDSAGVVDTVNGQLALELARRISTPGEAAVSALSKELRQVLALAVAGTRSGAADGEPSPPAPDEDEVTRARTRREEARKAAGLA